MEQAPDSQAVTQPAPAPAAEQTPEQKQAKLAIDAIELSRAQLAKVIAAMGPVAGEFGITVSPPAVDTAALTIMGKPHSMEASIKGSFTDGFETWLTVWDRHIPDAPTELILFSIDKSGNTDARGATQTKLNKFGIMDDSGSKKPKKHSIDASADVSLMSFSILSALIGTMS
jgi:hypothetical protein